MAVKKSRFDQNDTIPSDAFVDFWANGTNYRIPWSSYLNNIGVTGSLSQAGEITTVPVLDGSVPDYIIRNIGVGDDLTISLSPENAILIELDGDLARKPVEQTFSSNGTINDDTTIALSTGTNTLIMPTTYDLFLNVKSISGTITLDPGANSVENGTTVSTGQNRRFWLSGSTWYEL